MMAENIGCLAKANFGFNQNLLLEWGGTIPRFKLTQKLLHRRLGHTSKKCMQYLKKFVPTMSITDAVKPRNMKPCDTCIRAKMKPRSVHHRSKTVPDSAGDLIYADLKKMRRPDYLGNKYLLIMVDAATRIPLCSPMKKKSDLLAGVQSLFYQYRVLFGPDCPIKSFQPDNEAVFIKDQDTVDWIREQSPAIKVVPNPPYKKQKHGVAEKTIDSLLTSMRSLERDLDLPPDVFMGDIAETACYLKALLPHASLDFMTPYTRLTGKAPPIHHLRCIGSKVWVKDNRHVSSYDDKSRPAILLGYGHHSSLETYKVFTLDTFRMIYTEDCELDESTKPDLSEVLERYCGAGVASNYSNLTTPAVTI